MSSVFGGVLEVTNGASRQSPPANLTGGDTLTLVCLLEDVVFLDGVGFFRDLSSGSILAGAKDNTLDEAQLLLMDPHPDTKSIIRLTGLFDRGGVLSFQQIAYAFH